VKSFKNYPCEKPWKPIGLWDVDATTFSTRPAHRWRWGCQPYASTACYLQERTRYERTMGPQVNWRICLNLLQHYNSNMCVIGDYETPPPPNNSGYCLPSVRLRRIILLMSPDTARRSLNHISGSLHELITDQQCSNLLPRRPLETIDLACRKVGVGWLTLVSCDSSQKIWMVT
jgi:hypothetical protein